MHSWRYSGQRIGHNPYGCSSTSKCSTMASSIYAIGQATDNHHIGHRLNERTHHLIAGTLAIGRNLARTYKCHRTTAERLHISAHIQHRRTILHLAQQRRVARVGRSNRRNGVATAILQLTLRLTQTSARHNLTRYRLVKVGTLDDLLHRSGIESLGRAENIEQMYGSANAQMRNEGQSDIFERH